MSLTPTPNSQGLEVVDQATLVQRSYVTPEPDVTIQKHDAAQASVSLKDFESLAARVTALEAALYIPTGEDEDAA